jgi:hypothetical protein
MAYFLAKKAIGRDWMAAYSGCFRCGLAQVICQQRGSGKCVYQDVVMPLSWSAWGVEDDEIGVRRTALSQRWRSAVSTIADNQQFSSEIMYMWLGKGHKVFNSEQGSNMMVIAEIMLKEII